MHTNFDFLSDVFYCSSGSWYRIDCCQIWWSCVNPTSIHLANRVKFRMLWCHFWLLLLMLIVKTEFLKSCSCSFRHYPICPQSIHCTVTYDMSDIRCSKSIQICIIQVAITGIFYWNDGSEDSQYVMMLMVTGRTVSTPCEATNPIVKDCSFADSSFVKCSVC